MNVTMLTPASFHGTVLGVLYLRTQVMLMLGLCTLLSLL